MKLYKTKTIGREFTLDLVKFKQAIERQFDLRIKGDLTLLAKGYINVNFKFSSGKKYYVARVLGRYTESTLSEVKAMKALAELGVKTATPMPTSNGELIAKFGDYYYAVFNFLSGKIPNYTAATYERIGRAIAEYSLQVRQLEINIPTQNRFQEALNRKQQLIEYIVSGKKLLKKELSERDYQIIDSHLDIFSELEIKDTLVPIHSDIYNLNLLDNGKDIYLLDFEYLGMGPAILDQISYIAWDGITSDRSAFSYTSENGVLMLDCVNAYLKGYKSVTALPDKEEAFKAIIFLNVIDNIYNWEKVISSGENLYKDYYRHEMNIREFKRQKENLLSLF